MLAMEMEEERKARLEKMVATAQLMLTLKGVVDVGVDFVSQTHSENWQLYLSFKLDVLTTYAHN